MESIGKRLQRLRKAREWTQQMLGAKAHVTVTYVSRFENDEFRNPQQGTIERFAKALEVSAAELQYGKLAFTTEMPTGAVLKQVHPTRPRVAVDAPTFTPDDIPVVGVVQAGRGRYFDETGYPAGHWPKRLHRPEDVRDPHAYGLTVEGDSMLPILKKGSYVVCVTNREPVAGDWVAVQLHDQEVMVKELSMKGDLIVLKSLNPLHEPVVVKKDDVRAIHPVVWIKRR